MLYQAVEVGSQRLCGSERARVDHGVARRHELYLAIARQIYATSHSAEGKVAPGGAFSRLQSGRLRFEWFNNEPPDRTNNYKLAHQAAFHQHSNGGSAIDPSIVTSSRVHTRTVRGVPKGHSARTLLSNSVSPDQGRGTRAHSPPLAPVTAART